MSIIGIVLIVIFLGLIIMLVLKLFFQVRFPKIIKNISLAEIILAIITVISVFIAYWSYEMQNKLFMGQIKPLIDVSPIAISQKDSGNQAITAFSIVNYSGFTSYNIGLDLKYGSNKWISEWRKARDEKKEKKEKEGIVNNKFYMSIPPLTIPKLKPGETIGKNDKGIELAISGELNIENSVCSNGPDGLPVLIRVRWENCNGHVFDEIHRYRLLCTRDNEGDNPGSGRALTFIPEGIVSQKNSEK